MEAKYFWVLECSKGPKPFFAKPDASWTWEKSEAVKFKDWEGASLFRNEHAELKEYQIRHYDFSDDFNFKDETTWNDPRQIEMGF